MQTPKGNPRNFSYTLPISCDKDTFWTIWTDVSSWPHWDTPLTEAYLTGEFVLGAKGKLKTKSGQSSNFVINEFEAKNLYAFKTQLPGASLVVRRHFSTNVNQLFFTHQVLFEGPLAFVYAQLLGPRFMRDLPLVMENLKQIAES